MIWHLYDYYLNVGGTYFATKKVLAADIKRMDARAYILPVLFFSPLITLFLSLPPFAPEG